MSWFSERRLDFIDWRLATQGVVRRDHIMAQFDVSMPQASADIAAFNREHSGAMEYDKSAKCYVPAKVPYKSRRGMDDPLVRRAIAQLATAKHPMGWQA